MSNRSQLPSLRRLSLADIDVASLRMLIGHGEHLFVERKQGLPKDGLGRIAASFANSLGGWILLGVADNGSLEGYDLPERTDAQSHIGQLLANEVEPLPPFVAARYTLDDRDLVLIRVFESADTPHLVKRTGAVPIRTPKGTMPITDQQLLLQLARRGEAAVEAARARLASDLITLELRAPDRPDLVAVNDSEPYVVVRAGLVTAPPHFTSWAISKEAPDAAGRGAREIARILGASMDERGPAVSPRARGVGAHLSGQANTIPIAVSTAIDAAGVIGARIGRSGVEKATLRDIDSQYVSPLVLAVGDVLKRAGVYGRSVWRVDIGLPRQNFELTDAPRPTGRMFYAWGELSSPPEFEDSNSLISVWMREFAREMGVPDYE
jgi:hypothetical protein